MAMKEARSWNRPTSVASPIRSRGPWTTGSGRGGSGSCARLWTRCSTRGSRAASITSTADSCATSTTDGRPAARTGRCSSSRRGRRAWPRSGGVRVGVADVARRIDRSRQRGKPIVIGRPLAHMDREGDFVRGLEASAEVQEVVVDAPHDVGRIAIHPHPNSVEIESDGRGRRGMYLGGRVTGRNSTGRGRSRFSIPGEAALARLLHRSPSP